MAEPRPQRIVLDSNLVVSAIIQPQGTAAHALAVALVNFQPVSSDDTLAELADVMQREKFNRYLPLAQRQHLLHDYAQATQCLPVSTVVRDCRDPKDNKFLALALSAQAALIVSGDKRDLLAMHPYQGVAIVGLRTFLQDWRVYA